MSACTGSNPSGRSCLQLLAAGYILLTDMCPHCTALAMRALETVSVEPLEWHPSYTRRAGGGS